MVATSVSIIGCGRECTCPLGFRCGTIMVARIRSNGSSVSIGCLGRDWNNRRESEEKALLEELLSV